MPKGTPTGFFVEVAPTGNVTVNVSSQGAKEVHYLFGQASTGDLADGQWALIVYDGTHFVLNPSPGEIVSKQTGTGAGQIPVLNSSGDLVSSVIPNISASKITSGTMGTARLGSGTASSSTFLRGDQTWDTPAGGGGGTTVTAGYGLVKDGTDFDVDLDQLTTVTTLETGDKLVIVDESGSGDPTRGYLLSEFLNDISGANLDRNGTQLEVETDATATASTIPIRDSDGRLESEDPDSGDDVVNLTYFNANAQGGGGLKYYIDATEVNGTNADTNCDAGFHLCRIDEWVGRSYDTSKGESLWDETVWVDADVNNTTLGSASALAQDCFNWSVSTGSRGLAVELGGDLYEYESDVCASDNSTICCED